MIMSAINPRGIKMSKEFSGISYRYIFEGAGGMRDQLEQTILAELDAKQYPLKRVIKEIKAGGLLFKTREQCVVIEIDRDEQIIISNTTVGAFLYVEAYLTLGSAPMFDNIFKIQKSNAFFYAAKEAMESAFSKLGLKQANSGYKGDRSEVNRG